MSSKLGTYATRTIGLVFVGSLAIGGAAALATSITAPAPLSTTERAAVSGLGSVGATDSERNRESKCADKAAKWFESKSRTSPVIALAASGPVDVNAVAALIRAQSRPSQLSSGGRPSSSRTRR